MQAPSKDDEIRAAIIQDAIGRCGLHASDTHLDQLQEQDEPQGMQHQDRTVCAPPWPVQDHAPQQPSLEDFVRGFAPSPLETEVLWLRAALAQSTEREESLVRMTKTLRIELHKAYRLLALQQLNSCTWDGFPHSYHSALTQH